MATIYTRKGESILVDDEDYEWLNRFTWAITDYIGYPTTNLGAINGKSKTITMHRMLVIAPKGHVVDHINRDRTDNRKQNLRIASKSENTLNASPNRKIRYDQPTGKYWLLRGRELIGMYDTDREASAAFWEARHGRTPVITNTTIPID